jgi:peroxiredoxin
LTPQFDKQGIGLAAISADPQEDSAEFIEEKGIAVPLLSDPTLEAISAYGVAMEGRDIAVPATFIVSRDKRILWKYVGENMADRPSEQEVLKMAVDAKGK